MFGPLGLIIGNPIYRILAVAGLAVAVWSHGAVHGMRYEQNKFKVEEAKVIVVQRNNAAILNKQLSDQLFAEKAASELISTKNSQLIGQLATALKKSPAMGSPMCNHGTEVADQLNALIQNNRKAIK